MMDEKASRTKIEELGEFGLIQKLTGNTEIHNESTIKGVGDDAAVLARDDTSYALVSTDSLMEGVHFDLIYTPLKHLGYKAVVVNLSDIYAMNGIPEQVTVSLALSNKFTVEALEEIYKGIHHACRIYQVDLVGGDTTSSKSGSMINVTAVGRVKQEKVAYRDGARENDLLVVSGDLGGAYMGLQLLEREKEVFRETEGVQPDLEGHDYILERQLKPEARKDIIETLGEREIRPSSMIDISDGLASETLHICESAGRGVELYEERIPIDPTTYQTARDFDHDPTICAMSGGEDYELLFTMDPKAHDKILNDPNLTVIGHMTDEHGGRNLITKNERSVPITAQGWDAILKERDKGQ